MNTATTTTTTTIDTAETLAAEIVACWTEQAAPGQLMEIGDADEMGIYAELCFVPEDLQDEVVALVREGFAAYNATVTVDADTLAEWYDSAETTRLTESFERWHIRSVDEHIAAFLQMECDYVSECLGCLVDPADVRECMLKALS